MALVECFSGAPADDARCVVLYVDRFAATVVPARSVSRLFPLDPFRGYSTVPARSLPADVTPRLVAQTLHYNNAHPIWINHQTCLRKLLKFSFAHDVFMQHLVSSLCTCLFAFAYSTFSSGPLLNAPTLQHGSALGYLRRSFQ